MVFKPFPLTMSASHPHLPDTLVSLWTSHGLPTSQLSKLRLTGPMHQPTLRSSFMLGEAAMITTALSALAASYLAELREGQGLKEVYRQDVIVDKRHASLEFISEAWTLLDNAPPPSVWDPLAGVYRTKDGWVRVHTNFSHHRNLLLSTLSLPATATKEDLMVSLLLHESIPFETLATSRGCCVSALRTFEEWDDCEVGKWTTKKIERDGGPVAVVGDGTRDGLKPEWCLRALNSSTIMPLEGIKTLEMTRVIAGPVAGRTLARRGSEVLLITSPNLPSLPVLELDTTRFKKTAQLDLNQPESLSSLTHKLLPEADIFLQSYRPGSLSKRLTSVPSRPTITASLSAYGTDGPWGGKRGFDSLAQGAMGFNLSEAEAFASFYAGEGGEPQPRPFPVQAIDHSSGQLLAFGILVGLIRQFMHGGSYNVSVSLAGTATWIRSLGRYPPDVAFGSPSLEIPKPTFPPQEEIALLLEDYTETVGDLCGETERRKLRAMKHAGVLVGGKTGKLEAPMRLNAFQPAFN